MKLNFYTDIHKFVGNLFFSPIRLFVAGKLLEMWILGYESKYTYFMPASNSFYCHIAKDKDIECHQKNKKKSVIIFYCDVTRGFI